MNFKIALTSIFFFFSLNLQARVIAPSYTLRGIAYTKNHEPIRNQKLFVTQSGREYEIMTDSVGTYTLHLYSPGIYKGKGRSRRIKIRFGEKTVVVRNQAKKYYRKKIYTKEKDLQF